MKQLSTCLLAFCWACLSVSAQVNYTANNQVTPYTGKFRPGINMGYYPGWTNQSLADVAAGNPALNIPGIGAKTNRVGLLEYVMDFYGYDLVVNDFQHWNALGMGEYVAFIGGPTDAHREQTEYCPGRPSYMFANLYTPIWDNGANGTPYNDENYCAAYLYKLVNQYKDQVRFWEIWNEPGFDLTGNLGWRDANYPGNWWLEGPNPCDNILQAPIYSYTRTLRIAWEIIKTLDPDSYVCLGSVGYPSFLNALLRNTDNPNGGDVSPEYPLGGGAYFDCIAIHSYPHFDGSTLDPQNNFFERHSDQAADGVTKSRDDFQAVLDQYGYNGVTYPKKEWISTEINSPRKAFTGPYFAGVDAQINHMIKAQMIAKINGIHQLHPYQLFDAKTDQEATYEFDLMGMYKKIDYQPAYFQVVNDEGKAMKTMTDLIYDTEYDAAQTALLNLPAAVRGYAWKRPDGSYIYALWARTTEDMSEAATATYSFPATFPLPYLVKYSWDYGYTGTTQTVLPQSIALTARPVFFTAGTGQSPCTLVAKITNIRCDNNSTNNNLGDDTYSFKLTVTGINTSGSWTGLIAGQTINGTVGTPVNLGPYPISGGDLNFLVRDALDASCTANASVVAPIPCSIPVVYCASSSAYPWHDWIAGVQIGTLNQNSLKSGYSDFTALSTPLSMGGAYAIGLKAGFSYITYKEYWRVWIDANQNGAFETNEVAFEGIQQAPPAGTTTAVFNGILNVPANGIPGTTRMRVSMKRGAYPGPCETLPYGEVEDYSVELSANAPPVPYCNSISNYPWHDWITRVQVGTSDNPSGKSVYSDFTALPTIELIQGQPVNTALTSGFSYETFDEYWKIWIDYNHNGVFEESMELAYSGLKPKPVNGTPSAVLNGTFTVPLTALTGNTRMRVTMKRGAYATPCEAVSFGEVEDYIVHISPPQSPANRNDKRQIQLNDNESIMVYPNPANDVLNVDFGGFGGDGLLVLYNAQGKRVREKVLTPEMQGTAIFLLDGLAEGPYFVQLRVAGKEVGKMIVIHR